MFCLFDPDFGLMGKFLGGAPITASMSTVWAGVINPPRADEVKVWTYQEENAVKLTKGQEMGAFQLGSTVINLFPANRVTLAEHLQVDEPVRVGEMLATIN